jgi:hypothetical protein
MDEINKYWEKTKEWYDNIEIQNNIFPHKKFIDKNRNKFVSNLNKFLKIVTKSKNNNKTDSIYELKNYNLIEYIEEIIENNVKSDLSKIEYNLINLLNFDTKLKNSIIFLSKYTQYYNDIKNKIKDILKPILNEPNLFKFDDDIFRITAPIFFVIYSTYINNRDILNTIKLFLEYDTIFIQFFIVSYLILDDLMDDKFINENDKNNFMKWFINSVNNPLNNLEIPSKELFTNELVLKKCIIYKKYFDKFIDKYNPNEHMFIFKYSKYMIFILRESNIYQKDENITEEKVLEYSFKKSFAVSYFLMYSLNIHLNTEIVENLSKLVLLSQLMDDYSDIDKDNLENIYTYFNSKNIKTPFENRLKRMIYANYDYIKILDEKNKELNNFIIICTKYYLYLIILLQYDKINTNTLNEILEYQIFPKDLLLKLLKANKNNEILIIKLLRKYLT